MRKLQIEDAEVMRIAIQQEIGRSEDSRYEHRLHGLLLITAGQSSRQVAELFGENGTTVQRWVQRFEDGGLDALREGERTCFIVRILRRPLLRCFATMFIAAISQIIRYPKLLRTCLCVIIPNCH
jgi:Winged helix-turn helix